MTAEEEEHNKVLPSCSQGWQAGVWADVVWRGTGREVA